MSEREAQLWELGLKTIQELEVDRGILASGREEVYGCIFGRDSLLTSLSLLRVRESDTRTLFLPLVRKVLENLATLQGTTINIESGEEPGKCIHEFRPGDHDRLTKHAVQPWYVYPGDEMRNYDSVDSTPLFLMTAHAYLLASADSAFIESIMPNIKAALAWILTYGDSNGDGFIDYRFHPDRSHGGLTVQSWMDSSESLFYEDNEATPPYPIAPVEVQAYAYVALRAWSDFFRERDADLSAVLAIRARDLKKKFNDSYVLLRDKSTSLAYALDGEGRALKTPRSSMGHCLWAVYRADERSAPESILEDRYVADIARRLLARDMFLPGAGVRTLSSRSRRYEPLSYHNGSIWPHDTAMAADGLANFGFHAEAQRVREALILAYTHFNTPIELFAYTKGRFREYRDGSGNGACRKQAWSAASLLFTIENHSPQPTTLILTEVGPL
jgi:glycogen debranching enzyme